MRMDFTFFDANKASVLPAVVKNVQSSMQTKLPLLLPVDCSVEKPCRIVCSKLPIKTAGNKRDSAPRDSWSLSTTKGNDSDKKISRFWDQIILIGAVLFETSDLDETQKAKRFSVQDRVDITPSFPVYVDDSSRESKKECWTMTGFDSPRNFPLFRFGKNWRFSTLAKRPKSSPCIRTKLACTLPKFCEMVNFSLCKA